MEEKRKPITCSNCYDGTHVYNAAIGEIVSLGGVCSECSGTHLSKEYLKEKSKNAVRELLKKEFGYL